MKHLIYLSFIFFTLACGTEAPIEEVEEMEESVVLCESDPFQLTLTSNGITMTTDSCWVLYVEDPFTVNGYAAVLKWEYPGYPEWNGANSLTFIYYTDKMETGTDYQADEVLGVIEFDGSAGEMFQGLGSESLTVSIKEYNEQDGYICGSLKGQALFTDYSIVDVEGSFKGVLKPQ